MRARVENPLNVRFVTGRRVKGELGLRLDPRKSREKALKLIEALP
jgi:hypothetical protein